jgi:hypothetical protein
MIGSHMAQIILRLATIRRELKELESEEREIRDSLLSELKDWPEDGFPIRVGEVELRISRRSGRIDPEEALHILESRELLDRVPTEAVISDQQAVLSLRVAISRLSMPSDTQQQLSANFQEAIKFRPALRNDWLGGLYKNDWLDRDSYARCFKERKPVVPVLVVR